MATDKIQLPPPEMHFRHYSDEVDGPYVAIRKLRQVVKQHNSLFIDLYTMLCKPKLHYLTHIADCIEKLKTVMPCFSGESWAKR